MELKNEFLANSKVKEALTRLNSTSFDPQTAYNIKRLCFHFDKNVKKLQADLMDIARKHAVTDDKGVMVPPDEKGSFNLKPESVETYNNEISELMSKTFVLEKCTKIPFQIIQESFDLKIEPIHYSALEPIIEGMEI